MKIIKEKSISQKDKTSVGLFVKKTWYPKENLDINNLGLPWTQSYGICFNDDFEILIMREREWKIPGGGPEGSETPVQTLERELLEEVDIEIEDPLLLGAQLIEWLEGEDPRTKNKKHFQFRFICKIKKILPQTPDPANGKLYERKLVPALDVTKYVKWGPVGDQMFKEAIELARKNYRFRNE